MTSSHFPRPAYNINPHYEALRNDPVNPVSPLMMLGALAATLSPDDLVRSLDRAVELLRFACAADDCELFLREPGGGRLLLVACGGLDRAALIESDCFDLAEEDISGKLALSAQGLARYRRFLRRRLKQHDIHSYIYAPVPGPNGLIGCLNLAWRCSDIAVDNANELLVRSAGLIGTTVRAGLSTLRESVHGINVEASSTNTPGRKLLEALVHTAGARTASLILCAESAGAKATVISTGRIPNICADAVIDGTLRCPILAQGHGSMLAGCRNDWPLSCRQMSPDTNSPCCLPLVLGKRLRGAVVLDYGNTPPVPLTRDLVPLLAMTSAARLAPVNEARYAVEIEERDRILEVRCFGRLDVRLHGQMIPSEAFARRKALLLLKTLVLAGGNPISRDVLAERFWPGVNEKAGTNRLHGVVHALRSVIEPFRDQHRWIYICQQDEYYYFNMESPHWIDVHVFRRHADIAYRAERKNQSEEAISYLEKALAIYRGNLFEDEPYADWCALERTELQRCYLDLVIRLADLWIKVGEPVRGVGCLRRGLLIDPLREDLHQALIQALVDLGRDREALMQYRECVLLIRQELGTEPLPATRRLERLLLRPSS